MARRERIPGAPAPALLVVVATLLPPVLSVPRGMVRAGAMEIVPGQLVESVPFLSVVASTMQPPAPSVPRGMAPPGVMETASGQVDSAY